MTPPPSNALIQAALDVMPKDAAETEFAIASAVATGDVQSLWQADVIHGLAALDNINYGRLRSLIDNKFRRDLSPQLYNLAVKDARRQLRIKSDRPLQKLPDVQTNNRPMRDQGLEVVRALNLRNVPPVLFARGGKIVHIATDERGRPEVQAVTSEQFRGYMDRAANFLHNTETATKVIHPPLDIAADIMALGPCEWGFPALECIVEVPTLRPDGSILDVPGYDQQSGMCYMPGEGFHMVSIPDDIGEDDVDGAVALIDDAIGEFPMPDAASRANTFGLLLTPVIRPAIRGCVPLALIDAPQAGTGKSLLADVFSLITTGRPAPMMPYPREESEMVKSIGAGLMAGRAIVCFDNLEGAVLSPALALALTAREYEMRVLGASKVLSVTNRCTWLATGNNIRPAGDMPRRCYQIRIDAQSTTPYLGRRYKYPDLRQHVSDHRAELLRALLIIARAWFAAGRPTVDADPLGSFEEWHGMLAGILAHARVEGFLTNFAELIEGDDYTIQWTRFLDDIRDEYPAGYWFTARQIGDIIREDASSSTGTKRLSTPDSIADVVDPKKSGSLEKVLGRSFSKIRGKRHGEAGLYVEKHAASSSYRVMSNALDKDAAVKGRKPC